MISEQELPVYKALEELNINYNRFEHPPVYTCEEAQALCQIDGTGCKNLFLKDKNKVYYLLILMEHKKANFALLAQQVDTLKIGFAKEEDLEKLLGLKRGEVTPFGLLNDTESKVKVLIDSDLKKMERICFHPNTNTATISLVVKDFEKYLEWCGNKYSYVEALA